MGQVCEKGWNSGYNRPLGFLCPEGFFVWKIRRKIKKALDKIKNKC
jgi:hypothetical protein